MSTSCDQKDGVCENCITNTTSSIDTVSNDINDMNISSNNNITSTGAADSISVCANCGKEGSNNDINNKCNKCNMVKYCNAACKKKHRSKHKKACERYLAEQHDKELFKQPPSAEEDCPICFLRIPTLNTGSKYMSCCGKTICSGCSYAPLYDNQGNEVDNEKCPFCRAPTPTTEEEFNERNKKRVELNDANAMYNLGVMYYQGINGFTQDYTKALELLHRAGELGYTKAYTNIGYEYNNGHGVEVDKDKGRYYYELAAMGGNVEARHNLGYREGRAGNMDRAVKHLMIAVRGGYADSLNAIKLLYSKGHATKEDYTKALQLYQVYLGEIKSVQRDEAAAADERSRYY